MKFNSIFVSRFSSNSKLNLNGSSSSLHFLPILAVLFLLLVQIEISSGARLLRNGDDKYMTVSQTQATSSTAPVWDFSGTQVLKDGNPFWFKGVNYQPTPIGGATFGSSTVGWGNVGDWFNLDWNNIYKRDIPLLRAMKINVIKSYFFWRCAPITGLDAVQNLQECQTYLQSNPGLDHTEFLDMLWNNGVDPIFIVIPIAVDLGNVLLNPNVQDMENYRKLYSWYAEDLAATYGNHPAVLGFMVGNELNAMINENGVTVPLLTKESFWNGMTNITQGILQGYEKANVLNPQTTRLLSTALQNDPAIPTYVTENGIKVVDQYQSVFNVFTINAYNLCGDKIVFQTYQPILHVPMIYGEWGLSNSDGVGLLPNNAQAVADFVTCIFGEMAEEKSWMVGGFYFEFTDEWWKLGGYPVYVQNLVNSNWNEEAFGLFRIQVGGNRDPKSPWDPQTNSQGPADILTPLAAVQAITDFASPY